MLNIFKKEKVEEIKVEEMNKMLVTTKESIKVFYKYIQKVKGEEFNYEEFIKTDFDKFKEDLKRYTKADIDDEEYSKAVNEILKEKNGIRKKTLKEIEEEIKPLMEKEKERYEREKKNKKVKR